jgi:DNA invertase Pin-like site-specific DNA recombinase
VQAALEALARREAAGLVVAKLDRLSRSMVDFAGLMASAQKQQWALVALDVNVDTTTPAGEAMAHMLATFAQFERRLIGERTRAALAQRRAAGVRLGGAPEIDRKVVRRIVRERAAGRTLQEISTRLNADGVPTARGGAWYPSTLQRVLRREQATI